MNENLHSPCASIHLYCDRNVQSPYSIKRHKMKLLRCLFIVFLLFSLTSCAGMKESSPEVNSANSEFLETQADQKPFKYTITTDVQSRRDLITIHVLLNDDETACSGENCKQEKFDLDCDGNGEYDLIGVDSTQLECSYPRNSGKHQIWIRGDIRNIKLCPKEEPVVSVDDWGNIRWETMDKFASRCTLLNVLPDVPPDLSKVKSMRAMFMYASSFNQPLESWDVSNVTNMEFMFDEATSFNQPLEKWDVSHVTDMTFMFKNAVAFNQPIAKWNVSNVTSMWQMFGFAAAFNQPLNDWDVSHVTSMEGMFGGAVAFNQPLDKWNVSNVTTMRGMFVGAAAFNQPLNDWDVSHVTNMEGMFAQTSQFNQPLDKWNVSNVKNMDIMFAKAESFDQPLDSWDVSQVENMDLMFENASSFSHYPKTWGVPEGQNSPMFRGTKIKQQVRENDEWSPFDVRLPK